ncbi:helix-turn-helix transcriptional regulator [Frigoribacterium sp. 2-23]|uniref:helix-turn-helix transcriptional regulator n=1 Tax=Frigoribacterium sp. 2-23 TaxID=3415006 RepID=UPI003C6F24E8
MDRQQLATFLRSRRERLRPEDVGLPSGTRRRTPGLRREEVAVLAHISTEYYVRLEQGRAPRPSSEVLAGIAGTLRLTDAESAHLHLLAGTAPLHHGTVDRTVRPGILAAIGRMPYTAAIVISADFEVLAWNPLAAALLEDFSLRDRASRNLARQAFPADTLDEPPDTPYGLSDGAEFQQHVVMRLRATVAQHPDDGEVVGLVDELRARNTEFARLWERHDVQPSPALTKTFRLPAVGAVTVDCDTLAITEQNQFLVLYTAPVGSPVGSPDGDALALLGALQAEALAEPRRD